jgi:hypothetical protein
MVAGRSSSSSSVDLSIGFLAHLFFPVKITIPLQMYVYIREVYTMYLPVCTYHMHMFVHTHTYAYINETYMTTIGMFGRKVRVVGTLEL